MIGNGQDKIHGDADGTRGPSLPDDHRRRGDAAGRALRPQGAAVLCATLRHEGMRQILCQRHGIPPAGGAGLLHRA